MKNYWHVDIEYRYKFKYRLNYRNYEVVKIKSFRDEKFLR